MPTPTSPTVPHHGLPKVLRDTRGFVWTRPDGRQFRCRTMRQLLARIIDYDGHLLTGVLRLI